MRSFRRYAALALCLGILGGALDAADKEAKLAAELGNKDGKEKSRKGKSGKKDEDAGDSGRMSLPIQKGHDSFGLKIPYENSEGVLQMIFKVGRASRVDENHVQMADLEVETFDGDGKPEMTINLPLSILDLDTRILKTDSGVTVKRSDFEITGRSMEFDTKAKHGTFAGNVRMLIFEQIGTAASEASSTEEKTQ